MGRDTAFAVEKFEKGKWQIEKWINNFSQGGVFYPLKLLQYTPSHAVYGIAGGGEFVNILCGYGNDDEFWCVPITQNFGLPSDLSDQVSSEFNNSSDLVYGQPICITLRQLIEYDFTNGWNNEKKQTEPFSNGVLKLYNLLINELAKIGSPDEVRIIFWFF